MRRHDLNDSLGILRSPQVIIEQQLHLLRGQVLLLHVLPKLLCVGPHHIHCTIMELPVDFLVHNGVIRRVGIIDVLLHDPLALRQSAESVPVFQDHVAKAQERLLRHCGSICRGHLFRRKSVQLSLLLSPHALHLPAVDLREAFGMLSHGRLLEPLVSHHVMHDA